MKRFFFWSLLVSLVLILLGVIWFFFFKTASPQPTTPLNGGDLPRSGNAPRGSSPSEQNKQPNVVYTREEAPFLQKIWDKPVAGLSFVVYPIIITSTSTNERGEQVITQERSTSTYLFFVEKSTGNIYKKDMTSGKVIRITNTTIPVVEEAVFLRGASQVVMRVYNKNSRRIETFIADVPSVVSEGSPSSLGNIVALQDSIFSIAVSGDVQSLYYLVPNQKGSGLYKYSKDKNSVFVESLPLKDITLSVSGNNVFVVSKPSAFIPGYVFRTQPFVVSYGGRTGMSVSTDPSSSFDLVSMWSDKGLFSYVHNLKSGRDLVLNSSFMAEKCAWATDSSFLLCASDPNSYVGDAGLPEEWYQGNISFTDTLYLVTGDASSFRSSDLLNLKEEGKEDIDLTKPSFSIDSSLFSFINKKDGSLWLLDVARIPPVN